MSCRMCVWKGSLGDVEGTIDTGDRTSGFPMHGFTVQELTEALKTARFKIDRIAALPLLVGMKPDVAVDAVIADPAMLDKLVLSLVTAEKWNSI